MTDQKKAWDILTSDCPYEPDGEFHQALARVTSQEDVDVFEDMARAHQRAVRDGAVSISRASQGSMEAEEYGTLRCPVCAKRYPEDEAEDIYSDEGPVCKVCADDARAAIAACQHVWEPGETDWGTGKICSKCGCFVGDDITLSPPATPQAPEDVQSDIATVEFEAARAIVRVAGAEVRAFTFANRGEKALALAMEINRAFVARAHLLAAPVTVTDDDVLRLYRMLLSYDEEDLSLNDVRECVKHWLGNRIQIAGEPS